MSQRARDIGAVAWFVLGFDAGLWLARHLMHFSRTRVPAAVMAGRSGCATGCRCGCNGQSCACHG